MKSDRRVMWLEYQVSCPQRRFKCNMIHHSIKEQKYAYKASSSRWYSAIVKMTVLPLGWTHRTPPCSACWCSPPPCPGMRWTCPPTRASWATWGPTTPPRCCSAPTPPPSCWSNRCAVPQDSGPAHTGPHTEWDGSSQSLAQTYTAVYIHLTAPDIHPGAKGDHYKMDIYTVYIYR